MEKLKVGKILGTHGLKGEVKIRSVSDFNDERFKKGNELIISYNNQDINLIITTVRVHKGNYLISFENHQDINLIEKYLGCFVYALKDNSLLDEDEYFYSDIIGVEVYTNDDKYLGKVVDIIDNSKHDILVVKDNDKRRLIPYVDAFVKEEDIENGKIIVQLIKGMIDED